ncbi:hypothetical protein KGM_206706 [Danaus plexippus plexippus]|uniref:Uncharacterized protein n=1 Tax=Danaus plexippus plexippus TaxID=278856 RepID=A0A212F1A5_DANPL|nr:hypothetical protein KGM_206706 [Danaus plexippus plexippus]
MAELEFEAPLAQIEEADDCFSTSDYPQKTINGNDIRLNNINNLKNDMVKMKMDSNKLNDNDEPKPVKCKQDNLQNCEGDNFTETFSGSLEDLVNTFDEKITKCFGNYEESVEKLAPVQVRSQEEIMNECQAGFAHGVSGLSQDRSTFWLGVQRELRVREEGSDDASDPPCFDKP